MMRLSSSHPLTKTVVFDSYQMILLLSWIIGRCRSCRFDWD